MLMSSAFVNPIARARPNVDRSEATTNSLCSSISLARANADGTDEEEKAFPVDKKGVLLSIRLGEGQSSKEISEPSEGDMWEKDVVSVASAGDSLFDLQFGHRFFAIRPGPSRISFPFLHRHHLKLP